MRIGFVRRPGKDMTMTEYRRVMKQFKATQMYRDDCIDMVIQASRWGQLQAAPLLPSAWHSSHSFECVVPPAQHPMRPLHAYCCRCRPAADERPARGCCIKHSRCHPAGLQTGCLSESFDAPFVSVATVFHDSDSLVKFAQSVGRVVRRIGVAQTGEPCCVCC